MANDEPTHDYQVVINAPLEAVWHVLAERFESVDEWSSGVPRSRAANVSETTPSETDVSVTALSEVEGAPVPGRVCESDWRMFDEVIETIVEYGEDPYFFKYTASGTPAWMGVASNKWHVEAIDDETTLVYFEPAIEPASRVGKVMVPLFIRFARKLATDTLDDLKVYVETGRPSQRKQEKSSG